MTSYRHKIKSIKISSTKRLLLPVLGAMSLSGCVKESVKPTLCHCPPYPVAGPAVAAELEAIDPSTIPATIEWIQRLDRMADQIEVQNGRS